MILDPWTPSDSGHRPGIGAYLNFFLLRDFIVTHDTAHPPRFKSFRSMADSFYQTDLFIREVTDSGRKIVNLRIPVSLGRMALDGIPGLSGSNVDLVRRALAEGRTGTLLTIDDDGDGVRIALE